MTPQVPPPMPPPQPQQQRGWGGGREYGQQGGDGRGWLSCVNFRVDKKTALDTLSVAVIKHI